MLIKDFTERIVTLPIFYVSNEYICSIQKVLRFGKYSNVPWISQKMKLLRFFLILCKNNLMFLFFIVIFVQSAFGWELEHGIVGMPDGRPLNIAHRKFYEPFGVIFKTTYSIKFKFKVRI